MRHKEFRKIVKDLHDLAEKEMNKKQPEYTNENSDVLHNFKSTAEKLRVDNLKVWAVFFEKQTQSIIAHINNKDLKFSEKIESRFADIINYACLGLALFQERQKDEEEK